MGLFGALPSSWRIGRGLAAFRRAEDGSLLILSLFIFIIMLISTGVAIDLIRQEERRALIQSTLDRAVLAAADLNQSLSPEDVVADYFAKSGLEHLDVTPIVQEGDYKEWRSVEATIKDNMPTLFGDLVGMKSLPIKTQSRAEESIGNVEISMVLDVSGSMNDKVSLSGGKSTTRIALLKEAGKDFVDTMFKTVQPPDSIPGKLSISVVPYNQQVTLGTTLASKFNISTEHMQNSCVDLPRDTFSSTGINPVTFLARAMYGDSFDYWGNDGFGLQTNNNILNCPNDSRNTVMPLADKASTIKTKIGNLYANGDTAIDYGAKWGVALLDPAAQPAVTALITDGVIDGTLAERPFHYGEALATSGDKRSMKVLVLMTDGQNTRTYSTKTPFRTGDSPLVTTNGNKSNSDLSTKYLFYFDETKGSKPYYSFDEKKWKSANDVKAHVTIPYENIWAKGWTLQYVIKNYLNKPFSGSDSAIYAEMAEQSEFDDKDTDLNKLCTAAKAPGTEIIIFTVAVDAPAAGQTVLNKCATAPAYAFNVTSNDMKTAFSSIASAINALRLTN